MQFTRRQLDPILDEKIQQALHWRLQDNGIMQFYHQFRQPLSIQMAGSAQILLQFLCVCCRLIVILIGIF